MRGSNSRPEGHMDSLRHSDSAGSNRSGLVPPFLMRDEEKLLRSSSSSFSRSRIQAVDLRGLSTLTIRLSYVTRLLCKILEATRHIAHRSSSLLHLGKHWLCERALETPGLLASAHEVQKDHFQRSATYESLAPVRLKNERLLSEPLSVARLGVRHGSEIGL